MITTTALEQLGNVWPKEKSNPKGLSDEQIAQLQAAASKYGAGGKLDKAVAQLGKIDTSFSEAVQQFARDNSFEYLGPVGSGYTCLNFNGAPTPAWVRGNSLASMQTDAVRGQLEGYSVLLFVDKVATSYSGGSGRPLKPHFSRSGVIAVKLHRLFPQLVLDSNKNDKLLLKIRSAAIDKTQKLDLEGNFSNYFDFYAPKGINANTLTVLAPNFMQMLIDASATFDVEIIGDWFFMTTQDPLFTTRVMNEAMQALSEQLKYMQRLEQSWNYQPLSQPFDTLKQDETVTNFYAVKIGPLRIGLIQLVLISFVAISLLLWIFASR